MNEIDIKKAKLQALLEGNSSAVKDVKEVMVGAEKVAKSKGLPAVPIESTQKSSQKETISEERDPMDAFKNFSLRGSGLSKYPTAEPSVSEDAINALLSGNKSKAKQIYSEEREIPEDKFDIQKQLKDRAKDVKSKTTLPKSKLLGESIEDEIIEKVKSGIPRDEIREIIREEIYSILNEVYKQEQENKLMTETIHIRIGETIFSGNLTPLKKINKKK